MIGDPTRVGDIAEIIGPAGCPNIGRRVVVIEVVNPACYVDGYDRRAVVLQPAMVERNNYGDRSRSGIGAGAEGLAHDAYLKPIRDAAPPEAATIADELEFLI